MAILKDGSFYEYSKLIGVDLETYSPVDPPWKKCADPIVGISFAVMDNISINSGLFVISMIQPTDREQLLLRQSARASLLLNSDKNRF